MTSGLRMVLLVVMVACLGGVFFWLSAEEGGALPDGTTSVALESGGTSDDGDPGSNLLAETSVDSLAAPGASQKLAVDSVPLSPGASPAEATAEVPQVTLVGRVTNNAGRPVAGAEVTLASGLAPQLQALAASAALNHKQNVGDPALPGDGRTLTDSDGRFSLQAPLPEADEPGDPDNDVPPMFSNMFGGQPQLLISHPGFVILAEDTPPLHEGLIDLGTYLLQPAGGLSGRVLDGEGRPLAGARLGVRHSNTGAAGLGGLFEQIAGTAVDSLVQTMSDEDGRFLLDRVPAGRVDLSVAAPDQPFFQRLDLDVVAGAVQDLGDLSLPQGLAIAGLVLDENESPVPGALVLAERGSGDGLGSLREVSARLMLGALSFEDETDHEGRFELGGLAPGRYNLAATATGRSHGELADVDAGTLDVTLHTPVMGQLLVTVRSAETGEPVAGAKLAASAFDADDHTGDELEVVSGSALAELRALESTQDGAWLPLPEDLTGVFLVQGAGQQGTRLEVSADGYSLRTSPQPALHEARRVPVTVELDQEARLAGVVVNEQGQPVVGAKVTAARPEEESSPGSSTLSASFEPGLWLKLSSSDRDLKSKTDDTGHFTLGGLAQGPWQLTARHQDALDGEALSLQLQVGEVREDLQLTLVRGGTLEGTVIEVDGRPAPDALLSIARMGASRPDLISDATAALTDEISLALTGKGENRRQVRSNSGGKFVARGLAPGNYVVTLERDTAGLFDLNAMLGGDSAETDPERTQWAQVVAGEESHVSFIRPARARLVVRVSLDGQPAPAGRVSLGDGEGSFLDALMPSSDPQVALDADGTARFDDLEPGSFEVSVSVPGVQRLETASVELTAGQTEWLDVNFEGSTILGQVTEQGSGAPVAGAEISLKQVDKKAGGGGFLDSLLSSGNVTYSMTVNGASVSGSGSSGLLGLGAERTVSDEDGRFVLRFVEPGRWVVTAGGGDWLASDSDPVEIGAAGGEAVVALSLSEGASISGQVINGATEDLLDGVWVELQPQGDGDDRREQTSAGHYRFAAVPIGHYVLIVEGDDDEPRARRELTVDKAGASYTVHLVTLD